MKWNFDQFSKIKKAFKKKAREQLDTANHAERQVWYMPRPVILNELQSRRYVVMASGVICGILFLLLVWASIVTIDETAVTYGELVPIGKVNLVQHLEGGIIKTIEVKDGDQVKKGQLLATIDETASKAELQQLLSRRATLATDINRLKAFVKQDKIDIEAIKKVHGAAKKNLESIIQSESELLALENKLRKDQQDVLRAQIQQKAEEIIKFEQQILLIARNQKLLKEELMMYEELVHNHYVSKREYLAKKREFNELEGERVRVSAEIKKAKEALKESQEKLEELNSNLIKEAFNTLNKLESELQEVEFMIEKLTDKVTRAKIRSPIDGVVKGIEITPGAVVKPGSEIMSVVPEGQALQVETHITTLDVGHVQPGDRAKVKILTYDFARYGSISGTLLSVSATTFMDKDDKPYYKGIVKLDQQYVGKKDRALRAGMTVQADIVTGRKTLLQYLLKPVRTSLRSAFHER